MIIDQLRDGNAYSKDLMGDLTDTDNLMAISVRVQSLIGNIGLSKVVRLSLDPYRDGHAYRRCLMGDLTQTDNLIAMSLEFRAFQVRWFVKRCAIEFRSIQRWACISQILDGCSYRD